MTDTSQTTATHRPVLFGLGLEAGVHQVSEMLAHARLADEAELDFVSMGDHPYFAERLDAYSALAFVLGATSTVAGAVLVTNLMSRPAPLLARTVAGLSTVSGGRVVLPLGAGGMWEEIAALGVPRLSGGARIRALEEAIVVVRALCGGGDPVTFDGEFYQVTDLTPSSAPAPPIWTGVGGPKALAVTGRLADGWIPPHAADWRSKVVAEARPLIDEAAVAAGRSPADIGTVYLVAGQITQDPVAQTRNDDGRWIGGGVKQWVEELTVAALDHGGAAFNYLARPGTSLSDEAVNLWAREIAPAVREAVAGH